MSDKLKTASVLAFERKIDPSDATFYAGHWDDRHHSGAWAPVLIKEKSVRGTISNRLSTKEQDPAKLDAAVQKPNLQTVDAASLPASADTLKVQFTVRVLPGAGIPSACNSEPYRAKLLETVRSYVEQNGFGALALRYATNLANGRFLWRNRLGAESVEVVVEKMAGGQAEKSWTFDGLSFGLRHFPDAADDGALDELGNVICEGLSGSKHVLLRVTAFVRQGAGQEVFPSQELILEKEKGSKSRTLYHVDGVAAIHSQKVGNAIRTIDTWYNNEPMVGPIAVEPYGSVTAEGRAYRQPTDKLDFYTILDNWVLKDRVPPVEQQHFVMAVLVRGGVFGENKGD